MGRIHRGNAGRCLPDMAVGDKAHRGLLPVRQQRFKENPFERRQQMSYPKIVLCPNCGYEPWRHEPANLEACKLGRDGATMAIAFQAALVATERPAKENTLDG